MVVSDAPSIMIVVVDGSDGTVEGCVDKMAVIMAAMLLLAMALAMMG